MPDTKDIPVYLFTGFLEAGKTTFMQETLEDKRFNGNGEVTMLLLCEEGAEEYEPSNFEVDNVHIRTIESIDELTSEHLSTLEKDTGCTRVMLEYNGMWMLDNLYSALPDNWLVYQEFMFADANTIMNYNSNMRNLVVDKLKSCELVVFNRCEPGMDVMPLHKLVRAVSRRPDIAYEYTNDQVEYDEIVDPLPFDINADIIEIADRDYAIWYRDLTEELEKYNGKTVRVKGLVTVNEKLPKGSFVMGRNVMTCCVEDIVFAGLACECKKVPKVMQWITVTGKISIKNHPAYNRKGPVLSVISTEPADAPAEPTATFY